MCRNLKIWAEQRTARLTEGEVQEWAEARVAGLEPDANAARRALLVDLLVHDATTTARPSIVRAEAA